MRVPEVGRPVWYFKKIGEKPWAAWITDVLPGEKYVNVGGFMPSGKPFSEINVWLVNDTDMLDHKIPVTGHWVCWIPFMENLKYALAHGRSHTPLGRTP